MEAGKMDRAIEFIRSRRSFIVASHLNPDGDAIGSSLGLALLLRGLGKDAFAYNADPPPPYAGFLPGASEMIHDAARLPEVEAVIIIDSGDIDRPGPAFRNFIGERPVLNIDHHRTNTGFGHVNWVEAGASSIGEMLVGLARAMNARVSAEAAACLYTAIFTDTGSFQFSNTSPEALRAAADMVKAGASPEQTSDRYYRSKPGSHLLLLSRCLATLEFDDRFTRGDVVITEQMFASTGAGPEASEGIINIITEVETVRAAMLYREQDSGKWKVSLRSKGDLDISGLAASHGGGGHKNAAGCTLKGSLAQVKKTIRDAVDQLIRREQDSASAGV